ncbi:hypothetical protein LBMAG53_35020 [Planctomycetota bacterium]|nr:hypothetical protein LBMAG53_35020 [Planctomycetota bacterium]
MTGNYEPRIRTDIWTSPLFFVDHSVIRPLANIRKKTCARIPLFAATDGGAGGKNRDDPGRRSPLAGHPERFSRRKQSGLS